MKRLETLFYSTCVFLLTGFSTSEACAEDYFSNAVRIFSEGRFFEASIEFERAIFYEDDSVHIAQCRLYKSLCYKGMEEYDRALKELEKVNVAILPDTLFMMIRYEEAFCEYMINDVQKALGSIEDIKVKFNDSPGISAVIPLNILCLNACRRWDEALSIWTSYIEDSRLTDSEKDDYLKNLAKLYRKKSLPKVYSQKKAILLSCFIPGSGQMYVGSVGEGLSSLLLNAAFLGFGAWEFYSGYYLTGYFFGLRISNRFYLGGIRRANDLAKEKNEEGIRKFNNASSEIMKSMN
jgi:tetratricopeptide (TPR) repeat protein